MNETQRMYRDLMNQNFSKSRCKNCKYYVAESRPKTDFCNLIWPDPNQCNVLAEELNLKGK